MSDAFVGAALAAALVGFLSAYWDSNVIRNNNKLNHYLHAGVRGAVYAGLCWAMHVPFAWIIAFWFLCAPVHRLFLNGMMGWKMWYIGTTSWYDRGLHWIADKLNVSEVGQAITAIELMIGTVIIIVS